MNTFEDWIKEVIASGNLCDGYKDKAVNAISNAKLMDIVLDANGISYLCEMQELGHPLPYEIITSRFAPYINGRYIGEFKNEKGNGYTSALYCCHSEPIEINTTLSCLMGCTVDVRIKENDFVKLYCDKNTSIRVFIPQGSRAIIEYWGLEPCPINCEDRVEFIKH